MTRYRLVALDVDGTIRTPERPMSERTKRAIARVVEAGAVVTVATGRMFLSARRVVREVGLTSPVVSYQGALVAEPESGRVLWHRPMTREQVREALEALKGWDVEIMGNLGDRVYVGRMSPWMEAYGQRNGVEVVAVGRLDRAPVEGMTRLVAVGDPEEVRRLEAALLRRLDSRMYVTRSLPQYCEILHPNAGKHRALAWLCRRLGLGRSQVVAFGNGYNDVEMLEWAGLGVAVGDAVPEVLAVADMVAAPMEEDGAAQVLERLLDLGQLG